MLVGQAHSARYVIFLYHALSLAIKKKPAFPNIFKPEKKISLEKFYDFLSKIAYENYEIIL